MATLENDSDRIEALRSYSLLDTPPEAVFDTVVELASRLFQTPIALISLVDERRQWFKARIGLGVEETPRDVAFCDHAIRQRGPMVVRDALLDTRFATNPLVTGDPKIRFYCGVPLRTPEGHALGTLCIIDRVPRSLDRKELETLGRLASLVETEFGLRRRLTLLDRTIAEAAKKQNAKELLASMIVHDLRSPLTTISMLTGLLANDSPDSREMLDEMIGAADTMRRMLNDVLDICLGEAGQLKVRARPMIAQQVLHDSAVGWRRVASARSQTVALALPEAPCDLEADPELLGRVLTNLVGNAIDYGPARQEISVSATRLANGSTRFEVVDHAPTIPQDLVEAIFKPFERAAAQRQNPSGRGLGLAFCKLAVEAHGGVIGVTPTEAGNRFFFELPAH